MITYIYINCDAFVVEDHSLSLLCISTCVPVLAFVLYYVNKYNLYYTSFT